MRVARHGVSAPERGQRRSGVRDARADVVQVPVGRRGQPPRDCVVGRSAEGRLAEIRPPDGGDRDGLRGRRRSGGDRRDAAAGTAAGLPHQRSGHDSEQQDGGQRRGPPLPPDPADPRPGPVGRVARHVDLRGRAPQGRPDHALEGWVGEGWVGEGWIHAVPVLEVRAVGHRVLPVGRGDSPSPASPVVGCVRIRARPRDAWLFTEPTAQPSTAAVSASDRSSR